MLDSFDEKLLVGRSYAADELIKGSVVVIVLCRRIHSQTSQYTIAEKQVKTGNRCLWQA